jgi:hypothetical protein
MSKDLPQEVPQAFSSVTLSFYCYRSFLRSFIIDGLFDGLSDSGEFVRIT